MADPGLPVQPAPPASQVPQVPQVPQAPQQPVQPVQLPVPNQPIPSQQIQHILQLNWSHFKPEFSGKQEEDAETHYLRSNDWMDTHAFLEGMQVQHFVSH